MSLSAHLTLEPVVMTPLRRDWAATRDLCEALWPKITAAARAGKKGRVRLIVVPEENMRDECEAVAARRMIACSVPF